MQRLSIQLPPERSTTMLPHVTIHPQASATHHWLQGYSTARLGKPSEPRDPAFEASYREGYRRGLS